MEEKRNPESVPYIVHEGAMARNERTVKRMIIALVASIALLFASNALWLYAWFSYDYVSSVTIDGKEGYSNDGYPMDANGSYSYGRGRVYANRDTNGRYSGDGYSRDGYSWDGYSRDSRVTRQDLHRMVEEAVNERMRNM